jgi:hypothetical protein
VPSELLVLPNELARVDELREEHWIIQQLDVAVALATCSSMPRRVRRARSWRTGSR